MSGDGSSPASRDCSASRRCRPGSERSCSPPGARSSSGLPTATPVILVFKDLHWADAALLEFIEHLLTWSRSHPIYVVAMTRPDLFERHPTWGSGVRNATTLALEPLADEPMRELLHGLVPGLPEDAVAAIVERAEGVPLYAVETVRMLIDRGQLVAEGDGYALTGADRAPGGARDAPGAGRRPDRRKLAGGPILLADAAILGQSFTTGGPGRDLWADPRSRAAALDRLVKRELLIRDDDPRSPERGQYRFVQAVVREIAYETLSKEDRRAKHLAAARYFEASGDEEVAGRSGVPLPRGSARDACRARRRTPSPRRRALRCAPPRIGPPPSTRGPWPTGTCPTRSRSRPIPPSSPRSTSPSRQTAELAGATRRHRARAAGRRARCRAGDRGTENRARALAGQIYVNRSMGAEALAILEPAVARSGRGRA